MCFGVEIQYDSHNQYITTIYYEDRVDLDETTLFAMVL